MKHEVAMRNIRNYRKKLGRSVKKKKKEHLQKQIEEIEQLNRQDERRKFYRAMDNIQDKKHVEMKMERCCSIKKK